MAASTVELLGKVAFIVQEIVLKPGWDTVLCAAPFVGLLLAVVFRLDEVFAAHNRQAQRRRPPCGIDEDGEPLLTDPDGRLWRAPVRRESPKINPVGGGFSPNIRQALIEKKNEKVETALVFRSKPLEIWPQSSTTTA